MKFALTRRNEWILGKFLLVSMHLHAALAGNPLLCDQKKRRHIFIQTNFCTYVTI